MIVAVARLHLPLATPASHHDILNLDHAEHVTHPFPSAPLHLKVPEVSPLCLPLLPLILPLNWPRQRFIYTIPFPLVRLLRGHSPTKLYHLHLPHRYRSPLIVNALLRSHMRCPSRPLIRPSPSKAFPRIALHRQDQIDKVYRIRR